MGGSDPPRAGLKFANNPMATQQQKMLGPRPPHPQDSLAYTSERLQEAEKEYSEAKRMLKAWRKLMQKGEERLTAAADARARLRRIERVSMQKMGLDTSRLPPDFSDDDPDPEEKKKKLAEVVVVPRPSKSRKLA